MTTLLGLPSLKVPEVSEARRRAAIDKFWADAAKVDRGHGEGEDGDITAQRHCDRLGVHRICGEGEQGVTSVGLLELTESSWRKTCHKRKDEWPPTRTIENRVSWPGQLLHTATATPGSHYFEPGFKRHMSVGRMASLFGLRPTNRIAKAMAKWEQCRADREARKVARKSGKRKDKMPLKKITKVKLRRMLGGAIHIPTGSCAARAMVRGMGWVAGESLRWADMGSGVGATAAAVQQVVGQTQFQYVVAAERDADASTILREAWGLAMDTVGEAVGAPWVQYAGQVDAVGLTADCGPLSRRARRKGSDRDGRTAKALTEFRGMAEGAEAMQPQAVLVESVSDLLCGERVEDGERIMEILREVMPEMEWRAQVLDAHRHGAAAMARERAFIVGVRGGWAN